MKRYRVFKAVCDVHSGPVIRDDATDLFDVGRARTISEGAYVFYN